MLLSGSITVKVMVFIEREPDGDDVFVHFKEIEGDGFKTLVEGQKVEFGLIKRDQGLAAEAVSKLE